MCNKPFSQLCEAAQFRYLLDQPIQIFNLDLVDEFVLSDIQIQPEFMFALHAQNLHLYSKENEGQYVWDEHLLIFSG